MQPSFRGHNVLSINDCECYIILILCLICRYATVHVVSSRWQTIRCSCLFFCARLTDDHRCPDDTGLRLYYRNKLWEYHWKDLCTEFHAENYSQCVHPQINLREFIRTLRLQLLNCDPYISRCVDRNPTVMEYYPCIFTGILLWTYELNKRVPTEFIEDEFWIF